MTLTFNFVQAIIKDNVHTKFQIHISNGSDVRELTDGQTDGERDNTDRQLETT